MPGPGKKFDSYPILLILLKQSKKPLWSLSKKKKVSFITEIDGPSALPWKLNKKNVPPPGQFDVTCRQSKWFTSIEKKNIQIKKKKSHLP